ncbi:MAG: Ldh family oxidoreductase [Proteobacteria bacterium]|nr:Ldh family oxidoreductase [Pseudomonadota bacterium]MBU1585558.1 Ldh family oxidoreductase [Pseudomonadota bacterium]MBU2454795.1 Ldh family oxidoreductase [Pseudomonadota bacterium]MBU2630979.1 Ldh family oxidoreductase [Pseudomonadota bacterium]
MQQIRIKSEELKSFFIQVFQSYEFNYQQSAYLADGLLFASLKGIDTHGIRLFPVYCKQFDSGYINCKPNFTIAGSHGSFIQINADYSPGLLSGCVATKIAIEKAHKYGISVVAVEKSNHYGASSYYTTQMAENNCIGISMTNSDPLVAVSGSIEPTIGTNPISIAVKYGRERYFCLDMTTSQTSFSKIKLFGEKNMKLDRGWAQNRTGKHAMFAEDVYAMLPLGGYKGSGLGMAIDILCSGLSQGAFTNNISPVLGNKRINEKDAVSHLFIAISLKKVKNFESKIKNFLTYVRDIESIKKNEQVRVPGDRSEKFFKKRTSLGIPVTPKQLEQIQEIALNHKIKPPFLEEKAELKSFVQEPMQKVYAFY